MKPYLTSLAIVAGICCTALPAQAHRVWIVPAATVLSSNEPWVTFDAAVSNDIFHPDHRAIGLDSVQVAGPDGKPAAGASITVIPGGMRYRNNQNAIKLSTDKSGTVKITWPNAGMYFLEADYEDDKAEAPATERRGTYVATFEVLPL